MAALIQRIDDNRLNARQPGGQRVAGLSAAVFAKPREISPPLLFL